MMELISNIGAVAILARDEAEAESIAPDYDCRLGLPQTLHK